jgi:Tol biopolymer transport system component
LIRSHVRPVGSNAEAVVVYFGSNPLLSRLANGRQLIAEFAVQRFEPVREKILNFGKNPAPSPFSAAASAAGDMKFRDARLSQNQNHVLLLPHYISENQGVSERNQRAVYLGDWGGVPMMPKLSPDEWAQIRLLFDQASALPPDARPAFLEEKCANEDLRQEVRSLLEHSATGLGTLAADIMAETDAVVRETDPDRRLIGVHLGPYRVDAILGYGGMGAVYRATRDDAEFQQQVAIKLVRAAMQSPETLQRFKQERQILAHLAHPNIARLLDGGSTADGIPYLVMEFIEGEAITARCGRQPLSIEQQLALFLEVCEGVAFAHSRLVVHRDLKPGNILVTTDGTPKLLDFGIAKMLTPDAAASGTTLGMRAMTPDYAAPEQVRGDPVSKAVDVYALGLILYEILTGQKAQKIPDSSPGTVARVVCQTEPVSPAALQPALAGDLDNIIRMAIRKEPERRYASAADLACDIRLYLEKRPVTARPDTLAYRAAKFLQRNRAAVTGALITAVVSSGLALAYWLAAPGRAPRALRVTLVTHSGHVDPGSLATDGPYVYFVERARGRFTLARIPLEGGTHQPLPCTLQFPQILHISPDRTKLLVSNGLEDDAPLWAVPTNGSEPRRIGDASGHWAAWSPDGKRIVFARGSALFVVNSDGNGMHKLLDTPNRPDHVRWAPSIPPTVLRYAARMQGSRGNPWEWSLWEVRSDGSHPHLLLPDWNQGALHEDDCGDWIAGGKYYVFRSIRRGMSGMNNDVYSIWALKEGHRFLELFHSYPVQLHSTPFELSYPTPSLDGKRVFFISGPRNHEFVRYDAKRREFAPFLPGKQGRWVSFSKDGRWMAYTGGPHDTMWRSRPDGSEAVPLTPPSMSAYEPKWSPDGAWILFTALKVGETDGVYVVSSAGGSPQRLTFLPSGSVFPDWSPDGSSVLFYVGQTPEASGPGFYTMNWKTKKVSFLTASHGVLRSAWSPDGRHIAATDGTRLEVFDLQTRSWTPVVLSGGGLPFWSKNGRYLYYQNETEAEQPIFRFCVNGGRVRDAHR